MLSTTFAIAFIVVSCLVFFGWASIARNLGMLSEEESVQSDYPLIDCKSADFQELYRKEFVKTALETESESTKKILKTV